MLCKLKDTLCKIIVEGIKNATDAAKDQYPRIKSTAERAQERISEDAIPAINKAADNVSQYVIDRYSEAIQHSGLSEKEKKKKKMSSMRKAIIGATLGFAAGAATGYVIVKKNEIKESDYVFSDEDDFAQTYNPATVNPQAVQNAVSAASGANSFNNFNNNNNAFNNDINVSAPQNNAYQMSSDGSFIKNN